ncbi:MAG TPA: FmdB family zinc ribbon protein [Dehalococcoidia bacterium]|nr:FmdB family zinc ribbon protein [Dehalococcoidia bacterium]
MPSYDYKCACGHAFECRQGFDSEPFAICPSCGQKTRRTMQCPPVIFKGSGFYITDHRKDSGEEKPKLLKRGDGGDGKSDSKPEAKTDAKSETKANAKADVGGEKTEHAGANKD